jgi:hypothetical protein
VDIAADIAAVDIGAEHTVVGRTVAVVDHMQVDHTAAAGTVAGCTVVVVERMQVDHIAAVGTAAAAPVNNQVDRIVLDTAAAVGGIALSA